MAKLSKRIRELRDEKGITQQVLADNIGVSKSSINMYERGEREPSLETMEALADYFNVDLEYLVGKTNVPNRLLAGKRPNDLIPYNPIVHRIPILGRIAAGLPIYADENLEGETYTELNHGGEYFALRIKGDSMTAAGICDGGLVTIRRQPIVENGEIAAVRVNDDSATVKRFHRDGNIVILEPVSYNPEHTPQVYDLSRDKVEIIGVVKECRTMFDGR